ncbi:MAG: hypothetical protein AAGD06_11855 [Acidobacteriota bacterium]
MSDESQVPPAAHPGPPPPPAAAAPPPPGPPPPGAAPPPPGPGGESPNRQLWFVLSYLWIFALIPFLAEKNDREVAWHARHGLVITGAEILLWIVLNVLQWASSAIIGPLACFGCFAFIALGVASLVVRILCIVKAFQGGRLLIPGVSPFADQF